jgi:molecular chaperone DnaK (HSP70)
VNESQYVIGIDLGTTNSAVAYIERQPLDDPVSPPLGLFDVPQLVAPGRVEPRPVLPSFLYLADEHERASGTLAVPWDAAADPVGVFARDQGALVPSRQVASAKSWLAYGGVDRTAPILPFGHDPGARALSPVEASSRYLAQVRDAWNFVRAKGDPALRLEAQRIVLTVPASFDEEARELTVTAAAEAGLTNLTLIEEPLAALYAWIARNRRSITDSLSHGDRIVVCDVGGGTTDFSLIRVVLEEGELGFERVAIGEHLLLGGDNFDLALATLLEERLGARLSLVQRLSLRRQCTAAKERLLSDASLDRVALILLGGGRAIVGGTETVEVTRADVLRLLEDGFLPITRPDDQPRRERRPGALRELGLPYETDPAVTRHLARFLARAAREDANVILFNGGFFTPPAARDRVVQAMTVWTGQAPRVLPVDRPEAAVALGAAYYGHLRTLPDAMRRVLVRAGSPRSYYLGVDPATRADAGIPAIAVLPRGAQEGTDIDLAARVLTVLTNRAVSFPLYSSLVRTDPPGSALALDPERDDLHQHAPLTAVLRYGKRSRQAEIPVHLSVRFTELGTLELWLQSAQTEHRWRLQFQLRSSQAREDASAIPTSGDEVLVTDEAMGHGEQLVADVFAGREPGAVTAETLVAQLEGIFGYGKQAWPVVVLRRVADRLLQAPEARRRGPRFEARWLNLSGFCLRPGFGAAADEWRITEVRKVYAAGLAFPKDVQCQVEWLILWQRVSGGFSAGQQRELALRVMAPLGIGARKPPRLNAQVERESWRLLASLERVDRETRVRIGDELLLRLRKDTRNGSLLWALGRLGARRPFYGPLDRTVPPPVAGRWLDVMLAWPVLIADAVGAMAQIAARLDDAALDVDEGHRAAVLAALRESGAPLDLIDAVEHARDRHAADAVRYFGEELPAGLRMQYAE